MDPSQFKVIKDSSAETSHVLGFLSMTWKDRNFTTTHIEASAVGMGPVCQADITGASVNIVSHAGNHFKVTGTGTERITFTFEGTLKNVDLVVKRGIAPGNFSNWSHEPISISPEFDEVVVSTVKLRNIQSSSFGV